MNDAITIYYYTAWDGYSWQGCDEDTSKALQKYMDVTGTLPKSPTDPMPYGGAVPCKISGRVGVAVYRYHIRVEGDASHRDSLYIALAFIPLEAGCVDFAKILELRQLAVPTPGKLAPETVDASGLRLEGQYAAEIDWQEELGQEFRTLNGRKGLAELSRLFFSERSQLGFLMSVFKAEHGIEDIVCTQSYSVYPEVSGVIAAFNDLRKSETGLKGAFYHGGDASRAMRDAIVKLQKWADKQPAYRGLGEYCRFMEDRLRTSIERSDKSFGFNDKMKRTIERLAGLSVNVDDNADRIALRGILEDTGDSAGSSSLMRIAIKWSECALRLAKERNSLSERLAESKKDIARLRDRKSESRSDGASALPGFGTMYKPLDKSAKKRRPISPWWWIALSLVVIALAVFSVAAYVISSMDFRAKPVSPKENVPAATEVRPGLHKPRPAVPEPRPAITKAKPAAPVVEPVAQNVKQSPQNAMTPVAQVNSPAIPEASGEADVKYLLEVEDKPAAPEIKTAASEEAPVVDEEAPVSPEASPAVDEASADVGEEAPAAQQESPAGDEDAPSVQQEAPSTSEKGSAVPEADPASGVEHKDAPDAPAANASINAEAEADHGSAPKREHALPPPTKAYGAKGSKSKRSTGVPRARQGDGK